VTSDRDLVAAYLGGRDEAAFRDLYRAHTPALFRFAVLRVGASAAEDVVQETWLRAARTLERFEWRSSLRTWLTGIALNLCRDQHRRTGRLRLVEQPPPAAQEPAAAARGPDRQALAKALEALPEGAREVLLLHDVQGFTHEEIGSLLEISAGTSKSQLHRARRRLRRELAGKERDHG